MGQHADFDKVTVERSAGMARDECGRRDNRDKGHDR
jgi:hypothetical protein